MTPPPSSTIVAEPIRSHGLSFMNSNWNDSITNGELFHLNWDHSLEDTKSDLGVFSVAYLDDGLMTYKLAVNLTDVVEDRVASYTPHELPDALYVFWLRTIGEDTERWAVSPPWVLKKPPSHGFKWVTPIGIPIAVIMGVYILSLTVCYFHRRKKKASAINRSRDRRNEERQAMLLAERARRMQLHDYEQALLDAAGDRHPSVSSVDTAQTDTSDDLKKPEIAILPRKPSSQIYGRKPSRPDLRVDIPPSRRPSQTDLMVLEMSQVWRPSYRDLFRDTLSERRPSQPDSRIETRSSRRPSGADMSEEVSPLGDSRRVDDYFEGLPATEVGKAL